MSTSRKVSISPADFDKGNKAGNIHFETYQEDVKQIIAEEERTKDLKNDGLEARQKEFEQDVKQYENQRDDYSVAWKKEEKKIGGKITEGDLERYLIQVRGYNFKISMLLLAEVLFTASMMIFALGISRFKATVFAVVYPSLSSFVLKAIFNNFEKKNYIIAIFFIPFQIIVLGVLAVFAYINADASASGLQNVNIDFLHYAFIGLVTVLSVFLGYYFWEREKIVHQYKPLIRILKKKRIINNKLNDLYTNLNIVNDQLAGLDNEYDKIINLRIESYQAGYKKGVMPLKQEFELRLTNLKTEQQKINDQLAGLDDEFNRIKEARKSSYEAGYQEGISLRKKRQRFWNTILFRARKNEDTGDK